MDQILSQDPSGHAAAAPQRKVTIEFTNQSGGSSLAVRADSALTSKLIALWGFQHKDFCALQIIF